MTISVSFASDNDTSDVTISKNSNSDYAGVANIKANNAKTNDGSFTQLSKEINSSGNKLVLNKNYKYLSNDNPDGIIVKKNNLVIDGRGHTINANGRSRIFDIYGTNVVLQNMILTNSKHYGGSAIYISPKCNVKTINVTFKDDVALTSGIVYVESATYTSTRDKFIDCKSSQDGVISSFNSKIIINNDYMKSKHTLYRGFVASRFNSTISVSNSVFTNTQSKYSTAIFADKELTVQNSKLINLKSEFTGGAIALKDVQKSFTVTNCLFNNVTSERNGGAIFVDIDGYSKNNGYSIIKSSNFTKCLSGFGGAILQLGGKLTVDKCRFINNRAIYDGGSIYTSYTNLTIRNSLFHANKNLLSTKHGSAVYCDEGLLDIAQTNFTQNTGGDSAIYTYDSKYNIRNNIFKQNKNAIVAVFSKGNTNNNKLNGDKLSLNNNDFSTYVMEEGVKLINVNPIPKTDKLPSSYDYRKLGYVTRVKNQGTKNSCWSFAANAAVESSILKATRKRYDLSENVVFDSVLKYSKYGALDTTETAVIERPTGSLLSWLGTSPQEYDSYDELGKITELSSSEESIHIHDMMYLDPAGSVSKIRPFKEAIYKYGGIYVFITALYNDPTKYNKNTAAAYSNTFLTANHAVTIVGWDDNYSKNNFATKPPGNGAWIIKNSYGTNWGDKGYYYLSYYDKTILKQSGIVFIVNNTLNYNKNYQTDIIGNDDNYLRPNRGKTIYYMNKYTMIEEDYLAAVGTYFDQKGVNYEIEIYVNNKLRHTQKGTSPFNGFTTIKLKNYIPVKANEQVKVLVKSNAAPLQLESRQYAENGVSFYSIDKKNWIDLGPKDQTACLKLYTVDKSSIKTSNNKQKAGYTVTLYDKYGSTLKNTDVSIKVNNKLYNVRTNKAGVANIDTTFNDENYEIEIFNPDTEETYTDYLYFEENNTNPTDDKIEHYTRQKIKPQKHATKSRITYNHVISIKNNYLTLERLNNIFNQNFTNGHLLVYIDGKLVFNGTTTDELTQIIYDLLKLLSGNHTIKVEFTDENGNNDSYTQNITL